MNEEEAEKLIGENIENPTLLVHSFAVSSIMRGIAEYLREDVRLWGMCGLLHDIDFEKVKGDPVKHGLAAEEILRGNVDERVIRAIRAHNGENTGTVPESAMERCLISADSVSGLLIASTLVVPTKKIKDLKLRTVSRKFRDLDFARGCSRERMRACESAGIPIEKLLEISLVSLQANSDKLGL